VTLKVRKLKLQGLHLPNRVLASSELGKLLVKAGLVK
jgi:hypothetical protein